MPLTPRQERFVAEYLVDLNATQAAIRAGYSPHTAGAQGHDLLRKPEIASAVSSRQLVTLQKVAGSAEWIVEQAVEVVRRAMNAVPVRDSMGNAIEGKWQCDLRTAVPALALLAKRHPEFSEKHDVNMNIRAQVLGLVASMSEDELRAAKARLTEGKDE